MSENEQPSEPFQVIVESQTACAYQFSTAFTQNPTDRQFVKSQACLIILRVHSTIWGLFLSLIDERGQMFKNSYQLATQRPLRRHKQRGSPLDKSESER